MPEIFPALTTLQEKLAELEHRSLLRRHREQGLPCGPVMHSDGQAMLGFASNDYLGFANAPELVETAAEAARRWGIGSGASHLVSGHTQAHMEMNRVLAEFTGFDAVLGFCTGYLANLAVMPALLDRHDAIFADRLNHASLVDGALLARAELHRYPHMDLDALTHMLVQSKARTKLIVTDAVFSMDGDIAPLPELLELAERHDCWLLVDDAHGFGVLGPQGRGTLAAFDLHSPRLILMGTLGKAAGVGGAFVAGEQTVIRWLEQSARPYIFTTATPPLMAACVTRAIGLIHDADDRRAHLQRLIRILQDGLATTSWRLLPSTTAIQPVIIGENEAVLAASRQLEADGIYVPAIRPPTVPRGTARLRVSLSAAHTEDAVLRLTRALQALDMHGSTP